MPAWASRHRRSRHDEEQVEQPPKDVAAVSAASTSTTSTRTSAETRSLDRTMPAWAKKFGSQTAATSPRGPWQVAEPAPAPIAVVTPIPAAASPGTSFRGAPDGMPAWTKKFGALPRQSSWWGDDEAEHQTQAPPVQRMPAPAPEIVQHSARLYMGTAAYDTRRGEPMLSPRAQRLDEPKDLPAQSSFESSFGPIDTALWKKAVIAGGRDLHQAVEAHHRDMIALVQEENQPPVYHVHHHHPVFVAETAQPTPIGSPMPRLSASSLSKTRCATATSGILDLLHT